MSSPSRMEIALVALTVAAFSLSWWAWSGAPDLVPVHWNVAGEADRLGSKAEGLLLLPVLMAVLQPLLAWVPRFDRPRTEHPAFAAPYAAIRLALAGLLLAMHGILVASTRGASVPVASLMLSALGLFFAVLGPAVQRLPPNGIAGFRTPWTLASPYAWWRTHRLAGPLWTLGGLATCGLAWASPVAAVACLVGVVVFGALVLMGCSRWFWQTDPARG
jgi:uncharacterized membrane protein